MKDIYKSKIMNYVRWYRNKSGNLEVQIAEGLDRFPNNYDWKSYKSSIYDLLQPEHKLEKPLTNGKLSKGFSTFQECIKRGYKVVDINGNLVE